MSYSAPYIDAEGIHIPTYLDIRDHLIEEYKNIFGADVYLGEETMDYQMISVFARCLDDFAALVTDLYNVRNPNFATGNSLDLLLPLNGIRRNLATYSTVSLRLTGIPGVVVPAGSQAIDDAGYLWDTNEDCELNEEGTGDVVATCETVGAISAPANTINSPFTSSVYGWEGVNNPTAATVGDAVETDEAVKIRRALLVSQSRNGSYDSMIGALKTIDGMESVDVLINDTNDDIQETGQTAHSVCAIVYTSLTGEAEVTAFQNKVAETIWRQKAPGIATYGNTSAEFKDDYGHVYSVHFVVPQKKLVSVTINVNKLSNFDEARVAPMIKKAVMDEINALGVGKQWSVTMAYKDIYGAFSNEDCPFIVGSVLGSKEGGADRTIVVPCSYDEILCTTMENITINTQEG